MSSPTDPEQTGEFSSSPSEETTDWDVTADVPSSGNGPTRTRDAGSEDTAEFQRDNGFSLVTLPRGTRVRYFGDYELLSELGKGGMGVVYQARQVSLNRLVALKTIRSAEFAGEDQLRRFQNEAEAVAQLDHPHIVPIYEVGEHEDQRYFSMKLVSGKALDKLLAQYAANPRAAAEVMAQVAEAVHHAHERGILHRDLKPANILIDPAGQPHVTDFGLARKIETDSELTRDGTVVGTPSYMAPEQATGRRGAITTATDVYGLGATLYALLTGKAPFVGDTLIDTLEMVRVRPPQPPTRINPGLPRDPEVICLKCLEKDPRHRYASARDLAVDLKHWLVGEPIQARPVGPAVRLWMWCKRKPVLAALAASLVVATVGGAAGIVVNWREAVHQRDAKEEARKQAVTSRNEAVASEKAAVKARNEAVASEKAAVVARQEAEANFQLASRQATVALGAISTYVDSVQKKLDGTGNSTLRESLLETARLEIDKVARVAETYDKSKHRDAVFASIHQSLGQLYLRLGRTDQAFRQFRACNDIALERVKVRQYNDPSRNNLAASYMLLGQVSLEHRRDAKSALEYYRQALELFENIYAYPKADMYMEKDRDLLREKIAEAAIRVGVTFNRMGGIAESGPYYQRALDLRRELVEGKPGEIRWKVPRNFGPMQTAEIVIRLLRMKRALGYSYMAMADLALARGDLREMGEHLEACRKLREELLKANPRYLFYKQDLNQTYTWIGELAARRREPATGREALENAIRLGRELVAADPKEIPFQSDLARSLFRFGNLVEIQDGRAVAAPLFAECLAIRERIVESDPTNARRRMDLMLVLPHAGQHERAARLIRELTAGPNPDNELLIEAARSLAQCSVAASESPDLSVSYRTQAIEAVRKAIGNGYKDIGVLRTEPDLEPIRDLSEFQDLLKTLS